MHFEILLDVLFGPRAILHAMECSVCGHDEVYYMNPDTKEQIGRSCSGCNFVQTFIQDTTFHQHDSHIDEDFK